MDIESLLKDQSQILEWEEERDSLPSEDIGGFRETCPVLCRASVESCIQIIRCSLLDLAVELPKRDEDRLLLCKFIDAFNARLVADPKPCGCGEENTKDVLDVGGTDLLFVSLEAQQRQIDELYEEVEALKEDKPIPSPSKPEPTHALVGAFNFEVAGTEAQITQFEQELRKLRAKFSNEGSHKSGQEGGGA